MYKKETILQKSLLDKLEPELLTAATVIYEKPLYQYADKDKQIHVLFIGPEEMNETWEEMKLLHSFVQMSLICGQVLEHTLHLHIVAKDADAYKAYLIKQAPALEKFVCISGQGPENATTFIDFENVKSIGAPQGNKRVFSYLKQCRYIIVCRKKASSFMNNLCTELSNQCDPHLIVHSGEQHHASKAIPPHVKFHSMSRNDVFNSKTAKKVGEMAFYQHYYYARQSKDDPSLCNQRAAFAENAFDQRSNLTSVLHIKYKLFSIGINPNAKPHTIAEQYGKAILAPEKRDKLSNLEHSRWMMEKLLDGYRPPLSDEELLRFCYTDDNPKWHSKVLKMHNCLVTRTLQRELGKLKHDEWDRWNTEHCAAAMAKIDALQEYDPLDRMSLKVHRLAWEKLTQAKKQVNAVFETLQASIWRQNSPVEQQVIESFAEWIQTVFRGVELNRAEYYFELLRDACRSAFLAESEAQPVIDRIKYSLPVIKEFFRYKDYKTLDDDIVDLLPRIYLWPEHMIIVKLSSPHIVDLVASTLLLEPQEVTYFGVDDKQVDSICKFLQGRGGFATVNTVNPQAKDTLPYLKQLIQKETQKGTCVVDVTGADAASVVAVMDFVRQFKNVSVITCNSAEQRIENLYQFPLAKCVRNKVVLTVEEVFSLMGAKKRKNPGEFAGLLAEHTMNNVWSFFKEMDSHSRESLTKFCNMVTGMCNKSQEEPRYLAFMPLNKLIDTGWETVSGEAEQRLFNNRQLSALLKTLEGHGIIKNLKILPVGDEEVSWSYSIATEFNKYARKFLSPYGYIINSSSTYKCYKPLTCITYGTPNDKKIALTWLSARDQSLYINLEALVDGDDMRITYYKADEYTQKTIEHKVYAPFKLTQDGLATMEKYGLIYGLNQVFRPKKDHTIIEISFFLANESIKEMMKAVGVILEAKVWAEAENLGLFDDVKSGFKFFYDETADTENEIDILMTKGMQLYFISCKMPKPTKEHLYEVYCLSRRFSVNSSAAMVYAFSPALHEAQWLTTVARGKSLDVKVTNACATEDAVKTLLESMAEV